MYVSANSQIGYVNVRTRVGMYCIIIYEIEVYHIKMYE